MRAFHDDARRRPVEGADPGLGPRDEPGERAAWAATEAVHGARRTTAGLVDVDALAGSSTTTSPGLMLTNPNTLGLFEEDIERITERVHERRRARLLRRREPQRDHGPDAPRRHGVRHRPHQHAQDVRHPARWGRAGRRARSGVVERARAVPARCRAVERDETTARSGSTTTGRRRSAGCTGSTATSGSSSARTPTCSATARDGLREVSERAVLNANYLAALRRATPSRSRSRRPRRCTSSSRPRRGSKRRDGRPGDGRREAADRPRLPPPTVYFPLVVEEAMMVEPTETESKETLDAFAEALLQVAPARPRPTRSSCTRRR